jgi:hypothetical protein
MRSHHSRYYGRKSGVAHEKPEKEKTGYSSLFVKRHKHHYPETSLLRFAELR